MIKKSSLVRSKTAETEEPKATVQVKGRGLAGWTEQAEMRFATSLDAVAEAGGPHTATLDMTAWDALQHHHPTLLALLDILPAL